MRTTVDFLDAVKAKNGGLSDYALAPVLGVTKSQISRYRNKHDFLSNEMAIRVAELLDIDAGFVVACSQLERAKSEKERTVWIGFVRSFSKSQAIELVLC